MALWENATSVKLDAKYHPTCWAGSQQLYTTVKCVTTTIPHPLILTTTTTNGKERRGKLLRRKLLISSSQMKLMIMVTFENMVLLRTAWHKSF